MKKKSKKNEIADSVLSEKPDLQNTPIVMSRKGVITARKFQSK